MWLNKIHFLRETKFIKIENTNEKQTFEVLNDLIFLFFYCLEVVAEIMKYKHIKAVWKIYNLYHKTIIG